MPQGMYFGTPKNMQWIPAPDINMEATKSGWKSSTEFLNGGVSLRRSNSAHKRYNFSWHVNDQDKLQTILDYADGVFGYAPFYFLDPFAMNRNLLNQQWAFPASAGADALPLIGDARPVITDTVSNSYGYPAQTAVYTDFSGTSRSIYIPIPPGYTAYVGVHGNSSGAAGVNIRSYSVGSDGFQTSTATMISVDTAQRFGNQTFSGDTVRGIELSIKSGVTGTLSLTGIMVQVLKAPVSTTSSTGFDTGAYGAGGFGGLTVSTTPIPELVGNYISGRGHGGVDFAEQPKLSQYSAALRGGAGMIGVSADLWETNPWL